MGACYSKTSHDLANSPRHRTPHEKVVHRNGVATSVAYTPVNKEDVDTRNQNEAPRVTRASWARNSVSRQKKDSEKSDVCRTKSCDTTMGVVPSDSGIESLSPQEETSNVRDCKPQDSSHMHNGGCLAATACGGGKGSDEDEDIWILLTTESNSSDIICKPPSCPQRKAGQPVGNGECRTRFNSAPSNRNSDYIILKPSLKRKGQRYDRKQRLSWKSVDSLDWSASMTTSMDRAQSEVSDIFADDISLCAPLAVFDSVDNLGSTDFFPRHRTNSYIEYNSDTFQFQFDFSGIESNGDRLPQENGIPECTTVDGDDCLHASGSTALHEQPKFESTRSSLDMDSIRVHIPVLHSLASSPQDTG